MNDVLQDRVSSDDLIGDWSFDDCSDHMGKSDLLFKNGEEKCSFVLQENSMKSLKKKQSQNTQDSSNDSNSMSIALIAGMITYCY